MNRRIGSLHKEFMLSADSPFYSEAYLRVMNVLLSNVSPGQATYIIAPVLVGITDDVEYIVNFVIFMELELKDRTGQIKSKSARREMLEKVGALMSVPSDCEDPAKDNIENKCEKLRTWGLEDQKRFFSTRMSDYIRISTELDLALFDE